MYFAKLRYTKYDKGVQLKFNDAVELAFFIRDAFPKGNPDEDGNPVVVEIWEGTERKPDDD